MRSVQRVRFPNCDCRIHYIPLNDLHSALTEKGIADHIRNCHPGESFDDLVILRRRKQIKPHRATKWPRATQETSSSSGSTPSSSSMVSASLPRSTTSSATPPQYLATPPSRLSSMSSTHQQHLPSTQPSPDFLASALPLDAADLAQVSWPTYSISDWQQSLARYDPQNQGPSTSSTPYFESPQPLAAGSSSSPAVSFQDMYFAASANDLGGGPSTSNMPRYESQYPLAAGSLSSLAVSFQDTYFGASMDNLGQGPSTSQNQHQRSIPRWFQDVQSDATPSLGVMPDSSQFTAPLDPSFGSFMHNPLLNVSSMQTPFADIPSTTVQQAPLGYPGDEFHSSPFHYPVPSTPASTPFGGVAPMDLPSTSSSPFQFPTAPAPESTLFGGFAPVDLPASSAFDPLFGQTIRISQHTAPLASSSRRSQSRYMPAQPPRIPRLPELPQASNRAGTSYSTNGVPGPDFDATVTQPLEALHFPETAPLPQSTWEYPDGPDDLWDPVPSQGNFEPTGPPGPGDGV